MIETASNVLVESEKEVRASAETIAAGERVTGALAKAKGRAKNAKVTTYGKPRNIPTRSPEKGHGQNATKDAISTPENIDITALVRETATKKAAIGESFTGKRGQ